MKMTLPAVSIIAAICVLVAIVTYWSTEPGMIPLLQRIMPYMVQAWVYMALGGLFFIPGLIRMRGETMADRFSVDYSGSEIIIEALIKLQHLNMIPVMVFNFNPGRSSLLLRIGRIRKYRR